MTLELPAEKPSIDAVTEAIEAPLEVVIDLRPQLEIDLREPPEFGLDSVWVLDETHLAIVVTPDHPIAAGLIEHEVDQLVALGDREDESREWLTARSSSKWVAILAREVPRKAEYVEGIVRVTGPAQSGLVIEDLAMLLGKGLGSTAVDLERQLGFPIHPFTDYPTLDITPLGGETRDRRFANLFRLLLMMGIVSTRAYLDDGVAWHFAMVNPKIVKYVPLTGAPFHFPDYGVLEYKLSEQNLTPMLTQFIALYIPEMLSAINRDPSDFLQHMASVMAMNGQPILSPEPLLAPLPAVV
jgi:hypothetical protein